MSSFQIADCPTSLATVEKGEGESRVRAGKLSLTVRNVSERTQTARISVESTDGADPAWFAIGGAPSTNPQFLERDFDANATQTIDVAVSVPAAAKEGTYSFRVKATSEADPDNDFTESPAVALSVPALKVAPPPKKFPWWAVAVAAAFVVVVGVVAFLLLRPNPPDIPEGLRGIAFADAVALLAEAGFDGQDDIVRVDATAAVDGIGPGNVAEVTPFAGGQRVTVVVDPGVLVDAPDGAPIIDVVQQLGPNFNVTVANVCRDSGPYLLVQGANPADGERVAKGADLRLTTHVPPDGEGGCRIIDFCALGIVCVEYLGDLLARDDGFVVREITPPAGGAAVELQRNFEQFLLPEVGR